jgi:hypothetical protein
VAGKDEKELTRDRNEENKVGRIGLMLTEDTRAERKVSLDVSMLVCRTCGIHL